MPPHYNFYEDFAHRYDQHTPPQHYRHDHIFVLDQLIDAGSGGRRILDLGCGTGTFLAKAEAAGFDCHGVDSAAGMVAEAERKLGPGRIRKIAMEQLDESGQFDGIVALSWVINYAADWAAVRDVLTRLRSALVPGGKLILQCAHAPNMHGAVHEDRETGPTGEADDVVLLFQFSAVGTDRATARYVYACKSQGEMMWEEHDLAVADAGRLAETAAEVGFGNIVLQGSWKGEPIGGSPSVWLIAQRP